MCFASVSAMEMGATTIAMTTAQRITTMALVAPRIPHQADTRQHMQPTNNIYNNIRFLIKVCKE